MRREPEERGGCPLLHGDAELRRERRPVAVEQRLDDRVVAVGHDVRYAAGRSTMQVVTPCA